MKNKIDHIKFYKWELYEYIIGNAMQTGTHWFSFTKQFKEALQFRGFCIRENYLKYIKFKDLFRNLKNIDMKFQT